MTTVLLSTTMINTLIMRSMRFGAYLLAGDLSDCPRLLHLSSVQPETVFILKTAFIEVNSQLVLRARSKRLEAVSVVGRRRWHHRHDFDTYIVGLQKHSQLVFPASYSE